jgi:hypothetical protein
MFLNESVCCSSEKTDGINDDASLSRMLRRQFNIDALMLTRVWQEHEYRIDTCRVTRVTHIGHL